MEPLGAGHGLGLEKNPHPKYVIVPRQEPGQVGHSADVAPRFNAVAALTPLATKSDIADALGIKVELIERAIFRRWEGGWRLRLTKQGQDLRDELIVKNLVLPYDNWEDWGSGYDIYVKKNVVLVTGLAAETEATAEAVKSHLEWAGDYIENVRRGKDGSVVVTLKENGIGQRADLIMNSGGKLHEIWNLTVTKGWDAFPW